VTSSHPIASESVTFELFPSPPYSFQLALESLASSPSSVLETVDLAASRYERALRIDGANLLLALRSTGSETAPRLEFAVYGDALTDALVDAARQRTSRIFLLDVDPTPFLTMCQRDPILQQLVEERPGVRPLLVADPYEALLFAIVGQQVNVAFARKMKLALIEQFGERVDIGGRSLLMLPEPERIATLDPAELRALQFSRQKASYVIGLSQAIADGELNLDALGALPFDEAVAVLMSYRGIGRWTAEYVMMRGLGAPDSLPAGDLGLRNIIGYAYGLGRTASEAEVREIAEAWAGWRGWAAFLWWLELQTNGVSYPTPIV
jgi:DNA-3-methyladenine glycosylase II